MLLHRYCSIAVAVTVIATRDSGTPLAGMNYTLICDISGAGALNLTELNIKYNWTKNNDSGNQIQIENNSKTLKFSTLKLSDAGQYTCTVTLDTHSIYSNTMGHTTMRASPFDITVQSEVILCHVIV